MKKGGKKMWNEPTKKMLSKIPKLYSQENVKAMNKKVYMKFFIGNMTWYATEFDPVSRNFFGYVVNTADPMMSEWGYFNLDELKSIRIRGFMEVDRDIHSVNPYMPKLLVNLLKSDFPRTWLDFPNIR
jgi:hypothetical protein